MSRWGELIPHTEDYEGCLCGCQDEESTGAVEDEDGPQASEGAEPSDLATALIELRHARQEIARFKPFVAMADQAQRDAEQEEARAAHLLKVIAHLMTNPLDTREHACWSEDIDHQTGRVEISEGNDGRTVIRVEI